MSLISVCFHIDDKHFCLYAINSIIYHCPTPARFLQTKEIKLFDTLFADALLICKKKCKHNDARIYYTNFKEFLCTEHEV